MKALILAAGYATRLYPYTRNFPKPLLEVDGRPIIQYLVDKIDALRGVSEIVVVTNARFVRNFRAWAAAQRTRAKIRILNDGTQNARQRLGATGDMHFAFRRAGFNHDYLVLGGDNFFEEPLIGFVRQARKNAPEITIGISDIRTKSQARSYGVVRSNAEGVVTDFWEKPSRPRTSTVAMCLYYFPKPSVRLIEEYLAQGKDRADASGTYIRWLAENQTVFGFTFKNYWVDIGHIQTYRKVQQLKKGEQKR